MEHEETQQLMMAALDGELQDDGRQRLDAHLAQCGDCRHEWHALLAVDRLFRQTPALAPAADFTQRTLARLPNRARRAWLVGILYVVFFISGLVPLAVVSWLAVTLAPVLDQPSLADGLAQLWSIGSALVGALGQILIGLGDILGQYPAVLGALLLMTGTITLWMGVYQQVIMAPARQRLPGGH